jgi:RNA polymerase sigma factor (sigma-70 family)
MIPASAIQYSELQLVEFLKQKNRSVFHYLYLNYSTILYGIINKILKDDHHAEDVLQEVFIKIWTHIDQYNEDKGRLCTWMITIARRTAIDLMRSKRNTAKNKFLSIDYQSVTRRTINKNIDTIGVSGLVLRLRPRCKAVIDMAYYKGYTINEISLKLNVPEGTVKTRMREGIKSLRAQYGVPMVADM